MAAGASSTSAAATATASAPKTVKVTVDGRAIEAPEGTPLLQAMLDAGLDIPHYCYHPKLSIDGSCRLCQVKIEGMPKLQISCNTQVRDGMVVHTADPEVALARRGVLELLLINHPLDCPICDKAGECWLQNYAMRFGSRHARTLEPRRKHEKRVDIGERMLLDQERCILCRRCVRFCREISKTGELAVFNLGDRSVLDVHDRRLDNDYSICTADICPVGALESKDFHHRMRVWFLQETASVCPGCSNGCNIMICEARGRIWRLLPRRNDAVNDTWMCDQGRLDYKFVNAPARLRAPMATAGDGGALAQVSFKEALARASSAIATLTTRHGGGALGAFVSPHLTVEENFAFGQLMNAIGAKRLAMAVPRGYADDFLIKPEKAANARGVRELGLVSGGDDGVNDLLGAVESGEIKGLYICGTDLLDITDRVAPQRLRAIFGKLELLIVHALNLDPRLEPATVVFPTTTFAEKDGAFVNHAGRTQRIYKAIETAPGWLSDGEIFTRLLSAIDHQARAFEPARTWEALGRARPSFAGLSLEALGAGGAMLAGADAQNSKSR
ncbi:MAG TPA: 2Fe-2S iron-sulfur cluster-binding protein [Candidatus Binataceae bacterium]|nr:2Fe-2S iron-sulfur cluster-binding protein [Candidatus Binataceae bacterium]